MRWVLLLAVLATMVTLALCIISIALPYWLYNKNPYEEYQGLWQICSKRVDPDGCVIIKLPPEFLDAVRVMMLLGMCLYLFAMICAFVYLCCKTEKTSLATAATFLMLFGSVLCMIGVIVYGSKYNHMLYAKGLELHAGFALAVCSTIGGYASTVFYCMSKARGEID